jgi:hypothetical protein
MLHGRLYCTAPEAALLGAYLIQGKIVVFLLPNLTINLTHDKITVNND